MKNIHVLPTDKPSYLYQIGNDLTLSVVNSTHQNNIGRHIYITSDEEIKEGYYIDLADNSILKASKEDLKSFKSYDKLQFKKIILTTDQDLIKDGVQAIPDEFLEWFVKNPTCEFVNIITSLNTETRKISYEIIIPKEESKQETLEEVTERAHSCGLFSTKTAFIAGYDGKRIRTIYKEDSDLHQKYEEKE